MITTSRVRRARRRLEDRLRGDDVSVPVRSIAGHLSAALMDLEDDPKNREHRDRAIAKLADVERAWAKQSGEQPREG